MKKIKVEICVGTTCYVLGAAELQELERFLPEELRGCVEVSGVSCLGSCKAGSYGQAPFVRIDGEIMAQATVGGIIERIKSKLEVAP